MGNKWNWMKLTGVHGVIKKRYIDWSKKIFCAAASINVLYVTTILLNADFVKTWQYINHQLNVNAALLSGLKITGQMNFVQNTMEP